ncbi:hypothetical protein N9U04_01795 [Alphaproteobacteria bacterium]|nr:hypothetical protein [Alphaproteobacteria bacterium]
MTSHDDSKTISSAIPKAHPDKALWIIWGVMVLITIIALPFIVRQSAVIQAFADMCMTALSTGR